MCAFQSVAYFIFWCRNNIEILRNKLKDEPASLSDF